MAYADSSSAPAEVSTDTRELAIELTEERIDPFRVKWLIEDCGADVTRALLLAHLEERDLTRSPALRPLGLHRYLHTKH